MFVFLYIKVVAPIEKVELSRLDQGTETVKERQFVCTPVGAGIVKGRKSSNRLSPYPAERQKGWIGRCHGSLLFVVVVEWFVSGHGKSAKGFLWCSVEFQDLPSTRQENSIRPFVVSSRRIKQHRRVGIPIPPSACQKFVQTGGKSIQLSQIERSKVQKEIPIDELLINVETNYREFFIRVGCVEKGIAYQNLVVLQAFFQCAIIESVLKE